MKLAPRVVVPSLGFVLVFYVVFFCFEEQRVSKPQMTTDLCQHGVT